MDEQMILEMARAMEPDWFPDDGLPPLINNYPDQHLRYQEVALRHARAAHSVIAGKVAELVEALRHAKGRFLNINVCLSSGGTKREAIGIADVGEDCIKMLFARAALAHPKARNERHE